MGAPALNYLRTGLVSIPFCKPQAHASQHT